MRPYVVPGREIEIRCAGCGVWFPWTPPERPLRWQQHIPAYHSKACQNAQNRRLKSMTEYIGCPRPDKHLHTTADAARAEAIRLATDQGVPMSPYHCPCGGFHVGSTPWRRPRR